MERITIADGPAVVRSSIVLGLSLFSTIAGKRASRKQQRTALIRGARMKYEPGELIGLPPERLARWEAAGILTLRPLPAP